MLDCSPCGLKVLNLNTLKSRSRQIVQSQSVSLIKLWLTALVKCKIWRKIHWTNKALFWTISQPPNAPQIFNRFLSFHLSLKDLSTFNSLNDEVDEEMMKTRNNPTFLTQSSVPKVSMRLMGSNTIEFTIEGLRLENNFWTMRTKYLTPHWNIFLQRILSAWMMLGFS